MSHPTVKPVELSFKASFSLPSKTPSTKTKIRSSQGKRPRTALHDASDSEDERPAKHEAIASIEDGKTLTIAELRNRENATGPLIIEFQKTRDFRDEIREATKAKKGRNLLPPEVIAAREMQKGAVDREVVSGDGHEPVKWGLNISSKQDKSINIDETLEQETSATTKPLKVRTDDERAIDALMGVSTKTRPVLVIKAASLHPVDEGTSEEDSYRRAIRKAPDPSTLEDYERIPVEDYGAALLRGMGWNGKEKVKGPKKVERRANRLGLGAKALKNPEELGAWTMGGKRKFDDMRPRPNEFKENQDRKREDRDRTHGGYRRDDGDRRDRGREERSDRNKDGSRHREDSKRDIRHRAYDRDRKD